MLRTNNCGELNLSNKGQKVTLCGWIQKARDLGGMTFIDLRDRYGITQLAFNLDTNKELCESARKLGREYVIQVSGIVTERSNKNKDLPSGEIEIVVAALTILNKAQTPPFTIETKSDGGEELRMKYRYLDIRREPIKKNLLLRHQALQEVRKFLSNEDFLEIETPYLIKSTPEGARDFVVPSRVNPHEFFALPQSPQTFKQLLMVGGYDKYFQIVRCFRDEDLRADRQPEFTQIDCEMSFVEQEDILQAFEAMMKHIFKTIKNIDLPDFKRLSYDEAISNYGSDKPDLRFDMHFKEISNLAKNKGFNVFDNAETVVGICAPKAAEYSRKQLDALTDFVRKPQIGANGLIYVKVNADGSFKSSVDKFFDASALTEWAQTFEAKPGDLLLILAGDKKTTYHALNELRLEMGKQLGLRDKNTFAPVWITDFPLLDWDEEHKRFHAMHHPFTAPKPEDEPLLSSDPGKIKANAYDMVINGVELGGGSIRIHDKTLQEKMFDVLGFTKEEADNQFGFLMNAFEYGAPPHGGIAFGFDRICAMLGGSDIIRDYIAFPKNNMARDVMLDAPSKISEEQLDELSLKLKE